MANISTNENYIQKTLIENWQREMQAAQLYELSAKLERDSKRREILWKLRNVEVAHAKLWGEQLSNMGFDVSQLSVSTVNTSHMSARQLLTRIEEIEHSNADWYQSLKHVISNEDIVQIINRIEAEEAEHDAINRTLESPQGISKKLRRIWGAEPWHKQNTGDWVGDAIYGVNDGLGAIFGIIAGVAGYTANNQTILISGLFGALASTLSMGAGAWLATKSENELLDSELAREREEIAQDPEHEIEELELLYQLKGFSATESETIAKQIAIDPKQFLKTMAQEELGIHETSHGNPWSSALFGGVSTLVGSVIPLIPLFFVHGLQAMFLAAVISIAAHFAVGAAKSIITVRSWWASGLEMTIVGIIVGVVSYGLGVLGAKLL